MRASAEAGIVGCEATLVEIDPDDDYTNDVQLIIEPESESDPVVTWNGMGWDEFQSPDPLQAIANHLTELPGLFEWSVKICFTDLEDLRFDYDHLEEDQILVSI